jgi:hypothetical protein
MRFIVSHLLYVIVGTVVLAMPAGACMSDDPSTASQDLALTGDGPFANKQALIDYWNTAAPGGGALTQIYLNGRKVFERSGFGPAFVKQYFACKTGSILTVCTGNFYDDGYTSFNTLVSRCPAEMTIDKDGVLFRAGTNGTRGNIATCSGDESFYGTVHYYKITSLDGFVHYGSTCYP